MDFETLNNFLKWFSHNYDWIISTIIQGVIALIVFFLSIRLTKKQSWNTEKEYGKKLMN